MKGIDGAFASSFHELWQSWCVSQCELLFPLLCPSDVLLTDCKGRGFILSVHIIVSLLADSRGYLCISSYNLTQYPSQTVQILFCFINMILTTARAQQSCRNSGYRVQKDSEGIFLWAPLWYWRALCIISLCIVPAQPAAGEHVLSDSCISHTASWFPLKSVSYHFNPGSLWNQEATETIGRIYTTLFIFTAIFKQEWIDL